MDPNLRRCTWWRDRLIYLFLRVISLFYHWLLRSRRIDLESFNRWAFVPECDSSGDYEAMYANVCQSCSFLRRNRIKSSQNLKESNLWNIWGVFDSLKIHWSQLKVWATVALKFYTKISFHPESILDENIIEISRFYSCKRSSFLRFYDSVNA